MDKVHYNGEWPHLFLSGKSNVPSVVLVLIANFNMILTTPTISSISYLNRVIFILPEQFLFMQFRQKLMLPE
jgi:hypothetical protein